MNKEKYNNFLRERIFLEEESNKYYLHKPIWDFEDLLRVQQICGEIARVERELMKIRIDWIEDIKKHLSTP